MPHVEKREDLARHRVAHHELVGVHRVALDADAEELRLEERNDGLLVVLVLEDLVERVGHALARPKAIAGLVLVAVWAPEVDAARRLQLFREILADLEALNAVLDPEVADLRVGVREREPVGRHRMREERRIEVELDACLLRPLHPRRKVLLAELVAVSDLAFVDAVAGVEVDAVASRDQRKRKLKVLHELLGSPRLARVVASRLDAARRAAGRLKAANVVALPAMQRDSDLAEVLDRLLGVDADLGVLLLRFFVAHCSPFCLLF